MKKSIIVSLLLILLPFTILTGHGLHIDIKMQSPVVIATIGYSETQPLADGVVTIFSPSDGLKAYQTGRSDRSGSFAFIPGAEGEWTIQADDQKGHTEKVAVTVPAGFLTPGQEVQAVAASASDHSHNDEGIPVIFKIITGLSLIFGITGFFYGFQAKRSVNK